MQLCVRSSWFKLSFGYLALWPYSLHEIKIYKALKCCYFAYICIRIYCIYILIPYNVNILLAPIFFPGPGASFFSNKNVCSYNNKKKPIQWQCLKNNLYSTDLQRLCENTHTHTHTPETTTFPYLLMWLYIVGFSKCKVFCVI